MADANGVNIFKPLDAVNITTSWGAIISNGTAVQGPPDITSRTYLGHNGTYTNRIGVKTPNFPILRKSGQLPVQPYSKTFVTWSGWTGHWNRRKEGEIDLSWTMYSESGALDMSPVYYNTGIYYLSSLQEAMVGRLQEKVNNKLLLRAKDMKTNLLQVYAERQQAIDMVARTAKKLGDAMNALRHHQFKTAGRIVGIFGHKRTPSEKKKHRGGNVISAYMANGVSREHATQWLALQYGWKPLLSDIYGIAEELANRHMDRPRTEKIKASASESITNIEVIEGPGNTRTITSTISVSIRGGFEITAGPEQKLVKLGITNPALLAWELLPYSFIVDWFLPIGNYISTWDATWFQSAKNGYLSTKVTKTEHTVVAFHGTTPTGYGGNWIWTGTAGSKLVRTEFTRTVISTFPKPIFPSFKNPISTDHLWNALALFRVGKGG